MSAKITFSGGTELEVPAADAQSVMRNLGRVVQGQIQTPTGALPPGFVDLATTEGTVFVNPAAVAYIEDVAVQAPVLDQALET
jgi:hypothetical protein